MRYPVFILALASLLPIAAACGGGDVNRPVVLSSFPADNSRTAGPVSEIRITFDEPVELLNELEARVFSESRVVATRVERRPGEPNTLYILPTLAGSFVPGEVHTVEVGAGLVVNGEQQYALEDTLIDFTNGTFDTIGAGLPGSIAWVDSQTLSLEGSLPTPGGRTPAGLLQFTTETGPEFLVQLTSGGGSGESLYHFRPGDVGMTLVSLGTTGDLGSSIAALAPSLDGTRIYAAFEDSGTNRIRVFQIDRATFSELGSITPSLPVGATLSGFDLSDDGRRLVVAADDGGTGRYVEILTATLTEVDLDPTLAGTQGIVTPGDPGLALGLRVNVAHAPLTSADLDQIAYGNGDRGLSPFAPTGTTSVLARDQLGAILLHGLTGYAGTDALVLRTQQQSYLDPVLVTISDDVGAGPTGSSAVTAGTALPTENRFVFLLDTDVAVRMQWDGLDLEQIDEDTGTAGVQGIDVSASIPGALLLAQIQGQFE